MVKMSILRLNTRKQLVQKHLSRNLLTVETNNVLVKVNLPECAELKLALPEGVKSKQVVKHCSKMYNFLSGMALSTVNKWSVAYRLRRLRL